MLAPCPACKETVAVPRPQFPGIPPPLPTSAQPPPMPRATAVPPSEPVALKKWQSFAAQTLMYVAIIAVMYLLYINGYRLSRRGVRRVASHATEGGRQAHAPVQPQIDRPVTNIRISEKHWAPCEVGPLILESPVQMVAQDPFRITLPPPVNKNNPPEPRLDAPGFDILNTRWPKPMVVEVQPFGGEEAHNPRVRVLRSKFEPGVKLNYGLLIQETMKGELARYGSKAPVAVSSVDMEGLAAGHGSADFFCNRDRAHLEALFIPHGDEVWVVEVRVLGDRSSFPTARLLKSVRYDPSAINAP
jgi:hypothetical protein